MDKPEQQERHSQEEKLAIPKFIKDKETERVFTVKVGFPRGPIDRKPWGHKVWLTEAPDIPHVFKADDFRLLEQESAPLLEAHNVNNQIHYDDMNHRSI